MSAQVPVEAIAKTMRYVGELEEERDCLRLVVQVLADVVEGEVEIIDGERTARQLIDLWCLFNNCALTPQVKAAIERALPHPESGDRGENAT